MASCDEFPELYFPIVMVNLLGKSLVGMMSGKKNYSKMVLKQ